VRAEYVTENGKPTPIFDVHEGLWVEVTPTLYQDGWASIVYQFYEERNGQRHMLRGKHGSGQRTDARTAPLGLIPTGSASTVVSGSKAYTVSWDARVSAAE